MIDEEGPVLHGCKHRLDLGHGGVDLGSAGNRIGAVGIRIGRIDLGKRRGDHSQPVFAILRVEPGMRVRVTMIVAMLLMAMLI